MASILTHPTLTDGLLAYFKMDSNANDAHIGGHNCSTYGSPTFPAGALRTAAQYNGNSCHYIADGSFLNVSYVSVACWVYTTDLNGWPYNWNTFITKGKMNNDDTDKRVFSLKTKNSPKNFIWEVWGQGTITSSRVLTASTWYHLAATYDGSYLRLYINGLLDAVVAASPGGPIRQNAYAFSIGAFNAENWPYSPQVWTDIFKGKIDEIAIASRAWTVNEVLDLYHSGNPLHYAEVQAGVGDFFDIQDTGTYAPGYTYEPVAAFDAEPGTSQGRIALSWINPVRADFAYVVVRRSDVSTPLTPDSGTLVYQGTLQSLIQSGLDWHKTYYYSIWAYDIYGSVSSRESDSAIPFPDITPPGPVTHFTATAGVERIFLAWDNPTDGDFAGTIIRRSQAGYPPDPTSGELVYDGIAEVWVDQPLTSIEPYFYSAWAYDPDFNYSDVAHTSGSILIPTEARLTDIGILEALTEIIGEADSEIGGFRMTRTSALHSPGVTEVAVESTVNWPDIGEIAIDGVKYYYTGKTLSTFTGITHVMAGEVVSGTLKTHQASAVVADVSRNWSALDKLRRSIFVRYAEGEDLNVIGRNLGVPRIPIFQDDDHFRAVIQAIAYSPKGTILGLRLALDALVGAGNYELYEDLIRHPCTVFVRLSGLASQTSYVGKSFFTAEKCGVISGSGDTLELDIAPLAIEGVQLKNLDETFDFRSVKPSAVTYLYYPEAAAEDNAFTYAGTNAEGTFVTVDPGKGVVLHTLSSGTTFYQMLDTQGARVVPETLAEVSWLFSVPTAATLSAELGQISLALYDGAHAIQVGMDASGNIGLFSTTGGGFIGTTFGPITRDQVYEVMVKKNVFEQVELWVDGVKITTEDPVSFAVTAFHRVEFGIRGTPATGVSVKVKQLSAYFQTLTDYWSARGLVDCTAPALLQASSPIFETSDIGKQILVQDSAVTNANGGNNNGSFELYALNGAAPTAQVFVRGFARTGAQVSSSQPTEITIPDNSDAFLYPDDLGKQIVITGSSAGNNGTYTIAQLFDANTGEDLATLPQVLTARTGHCAVTSASFASEEDLDYRLDPAFVAETGASYEMTDAGSITDTTLLFRQSLWANDLVMQTQITVMPSAQLMPDNNSWNTLLTEIPPTYRVYPLYLADPMGIVKAYLDLLTVAGVIPELEIQTT